MDLFVVCLCVNKAWIYSTHLQLTDKPACRREVAFDHWLCRSDSCFINHFPHQVDTAGYSELCPSVFWLSLIYSAVMYSVYLHANLLPCPAAIRQWALSWTLKKSQFSGQTRWHQNISTHKDIHLFWSSKELTLNCPGHSYPIFSLHLSLSLSFLRLTHRAPLDRARWVKKTTGSPSIKLYFSNWLGKSLGHLGLIAGGRMRIGWQPARKESEALGHFTLCSQHTSSPCFTAHLGAARREWERAGVKKWWGWEGAWIR